MSWQYEPTKAERRAAALLREKGWRVDEPTCPLCHGWGQVSGFTVDSNTTAITSGAWTSKPCPNRCPVPAMYFGSATQSWSETLEQNGWTLS